MQLWSHLKEIRSFSFTLFRYPYLCCITTENFAAQLLNDFFGNFLVCVSKNPEIWILDEFLALAAKIRLYPIADKLNFASQRIAVRSHSVNDLFNVLKDQVI